MKNFFTDWVLPVGVGLLLGVLLVFFIAGRG